MYVLCVYNIYIYIYSSIQYTIYSLISLSLYIYMYIYFLHEELTSEYKSMFADTGGLSARGLGAAGLHAARRLDTKRLASCFLGATERQCHAVSVALPAKPRANPPLRCS